MSSNRGKPCPGCTRPLEPLDVPGAPAWKCDSCARGFWPAELTLQAVAGYDREARTFPAEVRELAEREAAQAAAAVAREARRPAGLGG